MSGSGKTHEVRAPARIDLAGGTLDIWPISQVERDAVTVNLAIERRASARVRVRKDGRFVLDARDRGTREQHADRESLARSDALPLHREVALHFAPSGGLEITTRSGVPAGSGLGGSSTLLVAMLRAVSLARGRPLGNARLLRIAVDLEARVIGVPTGGQDHVSAVYGGLSVIRYPPGGLRRTRLRTDLAALVSRLVLAYTGVPHVSATNNWEVTRRFVEGDADVRRHIAAIAAAAGRMAAALHAGDLDAASDAMAAEWAARKQLAPGVTTRGIEKLGRAARAAGARAMKVCGAGGGGCVVLWCAPRRRAAVARAARESGARVLAFRAAETGAE